MPLFMARMSPQAHRESRVFPGGSGRELPPRVS